MARTDPEPNFPEPEWAPIQELESVDLTGQRRDGGVDLVIVASQPLDGSDDTLAAIRHKVGYYLDVIDLPEFQEDMGHPPRDRTSIIIACDFPIHPWAAEVIEECQEASTQRGVQLVLTQKLN